MIHTFIFVASGLASYFSRESSGATMANGHPMVNSAHVCATRNLVPYGTRLLIVNEENHDESWCIVSDYGPDESTGRIIDVSPVVAADLEMQSAGVVHVRIYRFQKDMNAKSPHRRTGVHLFCPLVGGIICRPASNH